MNAAAIESAVDAVDADERGEAFDGRVFEDGFGEGLLTVAHRAERNALRSFGDAEDHAGVLYREKSFGNINVEKDGADERGKGDEQGNGAKT